MKSRQCIKNIEVLQKNSFIQKGLRTVIQNLQVGFLKQPILHLSKNAQKFLSNELIKWMEIISHRKIFQFANKIKQSESIEDNILWFSEHSFNTLQSFIVNQFEKAIVKAYFNRDRILTNYFVDLKEFCAMEQESFKVKNVSYELIGYPLLKTICLTEKEINNKFSEMKEIEEMYEREKQRIIQKLIDGQFQSNSNDQGKKKKRRVRRRNNKVQSNQITTEDDFCDKFTKDTPKKQASASTVKNQGKERISPADKHQNTTQTQNEQEKSCCPFVIDQMSVISKCQDSELHQTDTTIEKFLDNEEKFCEINENKQFKVSKGVENFKANQKLKFKTNQITQHLQTNDNKKQLQNCFNSICQLQQENKCLNAENILQTGTLEQSSNLNTKIAKKKKSKKQKLTENIHEQIMKSIRNNAFTEFIDSISIESNNLYNYKLSAYQFIVFFISSLLPTTNITLFGSNAVGLSLASSDIDIMISNVRWGNISQVREVLYHIGNEISKMGWVVDYRLILNAKVPVLKLFIDPKIDYFGQSPLKYATQTSLQESILIKADIIVNIEGDENIGCESTLLMKEWLSDHPQLQRIILFFKYILWYYGLNENYRGGICSYCLFLMVVHCLFKKLMGDQEQVSAFGGDPNPNSNNNYTTSSKASALRQMLQDQNEGSYIIQILKYYSEVFDPKIDQISITKQLKVQSSQSIKIKEKSPTKERHSNCTHLGIANTNAVSSSINNPNTNNNNNKRSLNLKIIDPINGQYIESSFSKFPEIQQLFSMILVESMKLDQQHKSFFNTNPEINQQINKFYVTVSQSKQNSTLTPHVITKYGDQLLQGKCKKVIKKVYSKLKKYTQLKYSVKDIVSIGFNIGIDNWIGTNNNLYLQQKYQL